MIISGSLLCIFLSTNGIASIFLKSAEISSRFLRLPSIAECYVKRKITVTRNAFVCVEFIYPRPPETIIAFIDPWVWNLFTVHLMMAIGLHNTTHSCPWESLLAAGVEECEKADKQ